MSAVIQVYTNPSCASDTELKLAGADYDLMLGPNTGLDGDTGDRVDTILYVKNTGDKPAIDVRLVKDNDASDRVDFLTTSMTSYSKTGLSLGDILSTEVRQIYVRVTVPRGTAASLLSPNFTFKYRSLP